MKRPMQEVYGYGWESPSPSSVIDLPLVPVRRRSGNGCCRGIDWRWFGIVLSLLAAASLALGVADVVLTYQKYMNDRGCASKPTEPPCATNNLVWTWVAVGIWASLPVFILGILAIKLGDRRLPQRSSWFEVLAFLCTFLFTPAMIALSVVEIQRGVGVYYWKAYQNQADDLVKAIIPIVIGSLGIIELLMCFIAFCYVCCCSHNNAYYSDTYIGRPDTVSRTFQQARKPCEACQGYSAQPRPQVYSVSTGPVQPQPQAHYQATEYGFAPRPTTYNYFNRPVNTHGWTHYRG